jgi:hypothetical protein
MDSWTFLSRNYYRSCGIYKLILVPGFAVYRGTCKNCSELTVFGNCCSLAQFLCFVLDTYICVLHGTF